MRDILMRATGDRRRQLLAEACKGQALLVARLLQLRRLLLQPREVPFILLRQCLALAVVLQLERAVDLSHALEQRRALFHEACRLLRRREDLRSCLSRLRLRRTRPPVPRDGLLERTAPALTQTRLKESASVQAWGCPPTR